MRQTIPQAPDSEKAVLGSILLNPMTMEIAKSSLKPEAFHLLAHRAIYETMLALQAAKTAIDCISVSESLTNADLSEQTGGMAYLMTLLDAPATPLNIPVYIGEVNRQYLRRLGILRAHEIKFILKYDKLPDGTPVGDGLDYIAKGNGHYAFSTLMSEGLESAHRPTCMEDVEVVPVGWYWHGWIPQGKFIAISGDPGIFKSGITVDLVARLTTGRPMPFTEVASERRNCLMYVSEDGLGDTVKPRLLAAGADVSRVFVYTNLDMPGLDLLLLEREIKEKQCAIVVIDVMNSFLPEELDVKTSASLRRSLLSPLQLLAEKYHCTICALFHLNKMSTEKNAVYRSTGLLDFVAAARCAIVCGKDPSESGYFVMARSKGNLSEEPPPLRYHIDEDSEYKVPVVRWDGVAVGQDSSTILAGAGKDGADDRTQRDFAILFLLDLLEDGAVASKEVKAKAKEAGIAERTVERAKNGLVEVVRIGGTGARGSGHWGWKLLPEAERDVMTQKTVDRLLFRDRPEEEEVPDVTPIEDAEPTLFEEDEDESGS